MYFRLVFQKFIHLPRGGTGGRGEEEDGRGEEERDGDLPGRQTCCFIFSGGEVGLL
jgi:hypothetical protein